VLTIYNLNYFFSSNSCKSLYLPVLTGTHRGLVYLTVSDWCYIYSFMSVLRLLMSAMNIPSVEIFFFLNNEIPFSGFLPMEYEKKKPQQQKDCMKL